MSDPLPSVEALCARVLQTPRQGVRRIVALVGPPASGKSTLADRLADGLNRIACKTQVVPMDGFHLHNPILIERGLLDRKGAPQTFDAAGLLQMVRRLAHEEGVFYPLFDRARDISIAGAGVIQSDCDTIVIEGNYLLLDQPLWREMRAHWDLSVMLNVAPEVLRERLIQRWLRHGLSREQAEARAVGNDLANAEVVRAQSFPGDLFL